MRDDHSILTGRVFRKHKSLFPQHANGINVPNLGTSEGIVNITLFYIDILIFYPGTNYSSYTSSSFISVIYY